MNAFSEKGVDVVDESDGNFHVSGHANRPDLKKMHDIVNPNLVIPMHGEHRHLRAHVALANEGGRKGILAVNGTMLEISAKGAEVTEFVETGRTYLDGSSQIGALDGIIRDRIRMALNGHILVTAILDEDDDPLGDPWVEVMGLAEMGVSNAPLIDILEEDLSQFIQRAGRKTRANDAELEKEMRRIVRNSSKQEIGKKPEVTVVLSRLG